MNFISDSYSSLWKAIIRPPRDEYNVEDLGPAKFTIGNASFERVDLELRNSRGHRLQCSHFLPLGGLRSGSAKLPCVVYCHGNCSSRLEAFDVLPLLLPMGVAVFGFDFSGSGRSDGEYISLGYYEQEDLKAVTEYLYGPGNASAVALWGRSMGAATSVLWASRDPLLAACVIDSAFASLSLVAEELVTGSGMPVPGFLLNIALNVVRTEVLGRANFDLEELRPLDSAPGALSPAFFATAVDDKLILPHHSQDLYDAWAGSKKLVTFDGGHNGERPGWFRDSAANFLRDHLLAHSKKLAAAGNKPLTTARVTPQVVPRPTMPKSAIIPSPPPEGAGARQIRAELMAMGFGEDAVAESLKRCSSTNAAVEWLAEQSAKLAQSMSSPAMRAPTTLRNLGSVVATAHNSTHSADSAQARVDASALTGTDVETLRKRERLTEELTLLGFSSSQVEQACRRCSSIEAAVEWLSTTGEL